VRRPWVKVCGITREEDLHAAVAIGVQAIGFILAPGSPRRVSVEEATRLAAALPPHVARVGVTVSLSPPAVHDLIQEIGLTAIQAHGEETPAACRAYGVPVVKAFRTGDGFSLSRLEPYRSWPVLLDAYDPLVRGGTGRSADWDLARRAGEAGYRVVLAGGLGPDNLIDAVARTRPVAVDLNSGVESAPGIKDAAAIRSALERLGGLPPPLEETWPW
jgi:phosphoribosylanthranilate isomerase